MMVMMMLMLMMFTADADANVHDDDGADAVHDVHDDDDDVEDNQGDTDVLAMAWLTTPCLSAYCLSNRDIISISQVFSTKIGQQV